VPATPPVALEEPIVVSSAIPISANTVGDSEPVAVSPVAGPVPIIVSIAFVTVPSFTPAIRDAIASVSIGKITISSAVTKVHVSVTITEVHVTVAISVATIAIISTKAEETLHVVAGRTASFILSRVGLSRAELVRSLK